ncbi:hypothetical protein AVEN_229773-1 [Araneus ventricosus]|uniref:Uncharacterized protein n=1 Tax=Araneus ventricosus TaxID=182803 RepID=A0A4Y2K736_ARAVE|nr:hypothetical protein AVEN_229773-1 [Araneus ventricosus]
MYRESAWRLCPTRKTNFWPLARRRLPFIDKAPEERLKVSSLREETNGLYLEGLIRGIPCLMLGDTSATITLLRTDLTQNLKEQLITTRLIAFL